MSTPPLWTLVISNVFVFLLGGGLTFLSYQAYDRLEKSSLRFVTLGFGLITLSAVVEVLYAPAIAGFYHLSGTGVVILYTIESLCIGVGLACIFYALRLY